MKNKIKKITVNSLFNSIQFNSIPKIVSLITLLSFILLFSISCNEDPTKVLYKVSDIEGTWESADTSETFTINGDGSINFTNLKKFTTTGHIRGYVYDKNRVILAGDEKYKIYLPVTLADGGGDATLTLIFNSEYDCTYSILGQTATFTKQFSFFE